MEVKVRPQTVKGEREKKELHVNICFPLAAWIETDTLHSLSIFPQSQFKSSTFVWDQEDLRESPGRKQTWQDGEGAHQGKV